MLLRDKVERINHALDEQKAALDQYVLKQSRPPLGGVAPLADVEHKQAFDGYLRRGDEQALRGIEQKAHSYASGPDGGYLVPSELEAEIGRRLAVLSPVRGFPVCVRSRARFSKAVFGQRSGDRLGRRNR